VLVVRHGRDARLTEDRAVPPVGHRPPDWDPFPYRHTLFPVYSEMLAQCVREYPGLPDPRTLTMGEIRWFYDWLRPALKEATKLNPSK